MMSRASEGQSWREAAEGEKESSPVLEEGSSKVWREGWQTDKQPGAEPKEEALNGGEETRGTKRDSTGKKLDNDEQLDEREGDRTEQESSRQLTYKQARRHPHAHYDGQIHINEHAQAHIHIHTHTHTSNMRRETKGRKNS
jgi:hypothetical protein